MSDITGDAFTIHAKEDLVKAIEHVGKTTSQMQVGKALALDGDDKGVRFAKDGDTGKQFIGIVKAASGEAMATFAQARMINDPVNGANPTYAPYYDGNVTVPAGKAVTVERNCITYVMMAEGEDIKAGQLIKPADDGLFAVCDDIADAVGRAYSANDSNNVARVYIRGI